VELLYLPPAGVQFFALGLDLGLQAGHQGFKFFILAFSRLVELDFPAGNLSDRGRRASEPS